MKRMVDDKEIRNFDDRITALEQGGSIDVYTKAESDAKFQTKTGMTSYVSKNNLTDYSINDVIIADSEIQSGQVDLRAISAQDVKSEVSLDPSSAIIKTTSGTNNSTIGVSGTEVNITTGTLKYNSNEVLSVDSDGNLNKNLIRTSQITSPSGEDTDSKGEITLGSGLRAGSAYIYAGGEESGASIYIRGTSSVGSEGLVEINGQTTFNTENRINVYDGANTNQIAYLSDIVSSSLNVHYLTLTQTGFEVHCSLITNSSTPFDTSTLTNYLITNSLTVPATGIGEIGSNKLHVAYIVATTGLTTTPVIAVGLIDSTGITSLTPVTTFTVTDTVITVKAI